MSYGGLFDCNSKEEQIKSLEAKMNESDFWNDKNRAEAILKELNELKAVVDSLKKLKANIIENLDLIELLEGEYDEELEKSILQEGPKLLKEYDQLELLLLLTGPYDKNNCIVEIHSGAGGTEACDWTEMLYRMYTRWALSKNYKIEVLDLQPLEEAGIKSVSFLIKGTNAYGYLKNEKGIHRLVRISPFDSNKRRHTSFASVEVTPEINQEINLEINDKDLKIDVYRSSGCGGQGVNTTDSAVRITHLPTGIVVTCQNERSQIQNKEQAMKVLKSKLLLLEQEKQSKELADIKGQQKNIEFGSQIRSYVLHPYKMIKDHRTNIETSNVDKFLDGDIDLFIESLLKEGGKNV